MVWELRIGVDRAFEEVAEEWLTEAGSMGVARDVDGPVATLTGYFAGDEAEHGDMEIRLRLVLAAAGAGECAVTWRDLPDRDWAEAWKESYHPFPVGRGLLIVPTWLDPPPGEGRRVIRMDPEMAFGSGSHATTRGCLELLEELALERPLGLTLDMGTGSGILAIGAVLLGADRVIATDTDPVAVETAMRNCAGNGVAGRVEVRECGEVPAGPFATVVANILATVLIGVAPALAAALTPGGRVVLSGILREQADEVAKAFAQEGLQKVQWRGIEEWVVLAFSKELA
ncbi:MAG: 50S ribosomal protein L11 methyltransferase [Magnetococcales bacterium]|nr:50S ribosomal protein L11 methyltransferase [Magnetococcales bacterium]